MDPDLLIAAPPFRHGARRRPSVRRRRSRAGMPSPASTTAAGLAVLMLVAAACAGDPAPEAAAAAPPVEAVPARSGTLPLEERLNGSVRAENQVAIRAEITAPIIAVMVRSGDQVRRGQPLARLDGEALGEQLRQAEASVRLAQAEAQEARAQVAEVEAQVVRTRALAAEELVSELELETQEARLAAVEASADQAAARVEQAGATADERRSALGKTVVRAPVSGRLGERRAEVGMLADPGTVLFLVGDLDELIVEVPLTGEMLSYIHEGQPVEITAPTRRAEEGEEPIRAALSRISPFLAEESLTTIGEIDLENPGGVLSPGMFVAVDVLYGESERATLVPTSALWEDPETGDLQVFVVGGEGLPAASGERSPKPAERGLSAPRPVTARPVEMVAEGRGSAGIRGVEPGEWVVTVGQHLLARDDAAAARVRATSWERVIELQSRQREDLLRSFLDKQQELARTRGAEPPSNEEFLHGGAEDTAGGPEGGG